MQAYTLTVVFNKEKTKVLMGFQKKLGKLNYLGGKIEDDECYMDASYRELLEESGITKSDIKLKLIRHEVVTTTTSLGSWDIYVTAGVLLGEMFIEEFKYPLKWVSIDDIETFLNAYGHGNCYTYLLDALEALN